MLDFIFDIKVFVCVSDTFREAWDLGYPKLPFALTKRAMAGRAELTGPPEFISSVKKKAFNFGAHFT